MNQINNKYICIHVNYKGIKGNFCAILLDLDKNKNVSNTVFKS